MDKKIYDQVCKLHGHDYNAVCLDAKLEWKLFCHKCGQIMDLSTEDAPQKTKVAA